jgi:hypothetical protein
LDHWSSGRKRRLSPSQLGELAAIVEAGPDREVDGVVRWRRLDLKRVIADRFGVDFHERYVDAIEVARLSGAPSQFTPARLVRSRRKRRVGSLRKRTRRNFVAHFSQLSRPPLDPTANLGPIPAAPLSTSL